MAKKSQILTPSGHPAGGAVSDPATELYDESVTIATNAARNPVEQWTNSERFSACVVAGASLRYTAGQLSTVHPCRVLAKEGGGFTVEQVTPPPVQQTKGVASAMPPNMVSSILERIYDFSNRLRYDVSDTKRTNTIDDLVDYVEGFCHNPTTPQSPGVCETSSSSKNDVKPVLVAKCPVDDQ